MKRLRGAVSFLLSVSSAGLVWTSESSWGAPEASPASLETSASYFKDDAHHSVLAMASTQYNTRSLFSGPGSETSLRLGLSQRRTTYYDKSSIVVEKQLEGKNSMVENSGSLTIDQGLGLTTSVGSFAGISTSPVGKTRFAGARVAQWWLQETLQTTLEVRRTIINEDSPPLAADSDGKRLILPETIDGVNVNLSVTQLTTPTTILRGNWSHTARSDRPDADGISLEGRQYITRTRSAVVAAISHYENVGSIRPVTTYGSVVANSAKLEWHQTLPKRLIAMAGYRNYVENEKPRAAEAPRVRLGSDYYYTGLRLRQASHMWTDDASELYILGGYYVTNEPRKGYLVGLGGEWLF